MNKQKINTRLIAEFILLCLILPGIIIFYKLAPFMFAFLWSAAGYCALVYKRHYFTTWRDLWHLEAITWPNMKPVLIRFIIAAIAMTVFLHFYAPERMLYLARYDLTLLVALFCLYPVLSALPQEFIFCSFFFKRYETFFQNKTAMIIASAVVFAFAHILFINPVAPTLSLIGGLIFASTFAKTQSLALVTIEHALYGNFLFMIGLGWYFYGGAVATG